MLFPTQPIEIAGDRCIFCSFEKEEMHHFPPRSKVQGGFLLPTCQYCNFSISNRAPFSLTAQLVMARKNLEAKMSKFEIGAWEWVELKKELAYPAESFFQKLELGKNIVPPPAANELLEIAKSKNFELCENWFRPARAKVKNRVSITLSNGQTFSRTSGSRKWRLMAERAYWQSGFPKAR